MTTYSLFRLSRATDQLSPRNTTPPFSFRPDGGRGFGFIQPDGGGEDLFCHASGITDGNALQEGTRITFDPREDPRSGKMRAENVAGGCQVEGLPEPRAKKPIKRRPINVWGALKGLFKKSQSELNRARDELRHDRQAFDEEKARVWKSRRAMLFFSLLTISA